MWVNGKLAGSVWKSPYRLEITKFLKPGRNKIEAEVGNVWANRCLYDATLSPEKRITWGNAMWFHYPEAGSGQKGTWTQGADTGGHIRRNAADFALGRKIAQRPRDKF